MDALMELVSEFEKYPTMPVDLINKILTTTKELKIKELVDKLKPISYGDIDDGFWDLKPSFHWVLDHKDYQRVKRRCHINKSKIGRCSSCLKARLNDKEEPYNIDEDINPNKLPFVKMYEWLQMRSELYYLETGKKVWCKINHGIAFGIAFMNEPIFVEQNKGIILTNKGIILN